MSQTSPSIKTLLGVIPQVGELVWIGIRPEKRGQIRELDKVYLTVQDGIAGDHYLGENKKRQVTLIQFEHIEAVESILQDEIHPSLLRRNLVIKGINLLSLKDQLFQIGEEVILQMTGLCHPCSRMESNLGPGGYQAMRGHGGITAKIIHGGTIHRGDQIKMINP